MEQLENMILKIIWVTALIGTALGLILGLLVLWSVLSNPQTY